jgi:hypothetical protein
MITFQIDFNLFSLNLSNIKIEFQIEFNYFQLNFEYHHSVLLLILNKRKRGLIFETKEQQTTLFFKQLSWRKPF